MPSVPNKVAQRIIAGIKRFQPVLQAAKSRDDGEADTVTIVTDLLQEVFGYDKYSEVTGEYAIRGTYCDLAIKIDGKLQTLIEVKAIGLELKDSHVKQAVDYAANQGVDWVILTNGMIWRVYKVVFAKPIDNELVVNIDFSTLSNKSQKDIESLFLCCKEGWIKSVLGDYHTQQQTLSRFFIGAMILSDAVIETIKRELRKVAPDVKVSIEDISNLINSEVLKREVLESEKFLEAKKRIAKVTNKIIKIKTQKEIPIETNAITENSIVQEEVV